MCRIRQLVEFLGLLTSACPAVQYGWVYTRQKERDKFLALNYSDNYNKRMVLPSCLQPDFKWWSDNIETSYSSIQSNDYLLEIFCDASRTDWRVPCNSEIPGGNWSAREIKNHINFLELKAAFYAIKMFGSHLSNCNFLLKIDNTTSIAYINKLGGIQHTRLNDLTRHMEVF